MTASRVRRDNDQLVSIRVGVLGELAVVHGQAVPVDVAGLPHGRDAEEPEEGVGVEALDAALQIARAVDGAGVEMEASVVDIVGATRDGEEAVVVVPRVSGVGDGLAGVGRVARDAQGRLVVQTERRAVFVRLHRRKARAESGASGS